MLQEVGPAVQRSADELMQLIRKALHQLSADGIEPLYFKVVGEPITREVCLPLMVEPSIHLTEEDIRVYHEAIAILDRD